MVSVKKLLGIEATSQGIQGQVGPGPPIHAFIVAELSGDSINERGPWAVASSQKGSNLRPLPQREPQECRQKEHSEGVAGTW